MNTKIPVEIFWGHRKRVRHPSAKPHLVSRHLPIDVMDPVLLAQSLTRAQSAIGAARHVWWVGDHKLAGVLGSFGARHQQQVIPGRWPAGLLTNFANVSQSPRWGLSAPHYPDLLVVLSVARQPLVVQEAKAKGIPIVGVVDSNANAAGIEVPIWANDDHRGAMGWLLEQLLA